MFSRIDDQVDVRVARAHAGVALAGADLAVEVERLAQADVDRAEAAADGGRDRPLQRGPVLPDRLEHVLGQRVAVVLLHHVGARVLDVPVELDAGRLEHAARRLGELGAGPVAGDQCHAMRHSAPDFTDALVRAVAGNVLRDGRPEEVRRALRRLGRGDEHLLDRPGRGRAHVPRLRHRRAGGERELRGGRLPPARGRPAEQRRAGGVQGAAGVGA